MNAADRSHARNPPADAQDHRPIDLFPQYGVRAADAIGFFRRNRSSFYSQAELFLEALKAYRLFAELLDYYLCKQEILPIQLAKRIFVEPATVSHWRKNRRLPENLAILHQVTLALDLSAPEQENLVVAWCNTRLVRDLIPYIEEATRTNNVEHALQVAQLMIGNAQSAQRTARYPYDKRIDQHTGAG